MNLLSKAVKYPTQRNAAKHSGHIEVTNTTRTPWDTRSFLDIASTILGPSYTLSIVLIGDTRARTLNRTYRNKETKANVLSFPLTKTVGEVFINIARVQREATTFELSSHGHAQFLLIHACLHLLGHDHGSRMEEAEQIYLKKFSIR